MPTEQTPLSHLLIPLFEELEKRTLKYCVCGNYKGLPYHTDNDVDIWAKEPANIIRIIEYICKQLQYKIYLKNANSTGVNLFIYTTIDNQNILLHLDVLRECRWRSFLPLVRSQIIENHRKQYNDIWVANETVDAAMHLMYPLTHFGEVTPKYHDDISKEAKKEDFWQIIDNGWGTPFTQKAKTLVKGQDWTGLANAFSKQKINLTFYSLGKIGLSEIESVFTFMTSNIKRLIKPNGLFIAFIGPDGCGKTTIQSNLQPFFKKGFTKGKIKQFYWRPFLLPRIQTLIPGGKKNIINNGVSEDPSERLDLRTVGLSRRLSHCVKLFYYWFDYILGRIKYQGAWSRGGVVCFDRYWGDLLVFSERFGLNVPTWLVKLLGCFVPKPDIVFYLHAEPEVLIARKLELPLEEMTRQTNHYKKLCKHYDNYTQINGDQPQERVVVDVINACLEKMSQRYI